MERVGATCFFSGTELGRRGACVGCIGEPVGEGDSEFGDNGELLVVDGSGGGPC